MTVDDALMEMAAVDWGSVRSIAGSSSFVPDAFRDLVLAIADDDAEEAYWRLDNMVVVQGQLFEAGALLVGPLLTALEGDLSPAARLRVLDLLVEIAGGGPDESEVALGNQALTQEALRRVAERLDAIRASLSDPSPRIRVGALDLLDLADEDRARMRALAATLVSGDPDARARARAALVAGWSGDDQA